MTEQINDMASLLIIDDERLLARTLASIFTNHGYRVKWAETGEAGLALFQDGVDIVLLDLKLPDMTGTEVLRELKRRRPETIVILMTAFASLENAVAVMKEGAQAYLTKPFEVNELLAMIEKALAEQRSRRQDRQLLGNLSLIYKISKEMEGVIELQSVAGLAGRYLADTLVTDVCGVLVRDLEVNRFAFAAVRGAAGTKTDLLDKRFSLDPVVYEQLVKRQQALLIPELKSRPAILENLAIQSPQSLFIFPLVARQKTVGLALFVSEKSMTLRDDDVRRVSAVSAEIAPCLENAMRYLELKQNYVNAVIELSRAGAQREGIPQGHADIVAETSAAVSRQLGLPREEVEAVRMAALLHDMGRVVISEQILLKKGALSSDEYAVVKQHSAVAAGIVAHIDTDKRIMPIILHHHERMDGGGYPNGLVGNAIPLGARILAVCDAFQAMISERPYRSALTGNDAVLELRRCSGKQFDAQVVGAFITVRAQQIARESGFS